MAVGVAEPTGALRAVVTAGLLAGVGGYAAWLTWAMTALPYDSWAPAVAGPVLVLVSVPVLLRVAHRGGPPFGVLLVALVVKLAAAFAFLRVTTDVYDGVADYTFYDQTGATLAEAYRAGDWGTHVDAVPGYGFVQIVTAVVYRFLGTSVQVGFLVFSWLAFWGLLLVVLAIRTAVPKADQRRVTALVLFLPSTVFWSSSLGKDSWMIFAIGVTVWGTARLLTKGMSGLPAVLVGLTAAALVRPHVALMLLAALGIAFLTRRTDRRPMALVTRVVGVTVLGVTGLLLLTHTQEFLNVDSLSPAGIDAALSKASTASAGGGAAIEPPRGGLVTRIPWAVATVLFRPFPWEAHNVQGLVAAAEGVLLLVLTWRARRALRAIPSRVRTEPFLVFVLTYLALFVFAFSSFANLGTLARERIQVLPVAVVLICPTRSPRRPVEPVLPDLYRYVGSRT